MECGRISSILNRNLFGFISFLKLFIFYIEPKKSTYSGHSVGYTAVEADNELWRRIILNTPWLWKSKGTRKGIEFLLTFIGTPNGLITFNEYVYKADKPIDVNLFTTLLEINGLDTDITNYPIDSDGYPRFLDDSDDMYFQGNGLWYRETSGPNSILDITNGNNPHVGPYDGGYKYFNQLIELIPDFTPVTITSTSVTTTSEDLFTNYNTGEITDYVGDTYVDLVSFPTNVTLPNCYINTTEIIRDPKPQAIKTDCGCPLNKNDDSLSICIEKTQEAQQKDCSYILNTSQQQTGLVVFTQRYDDSSGNDTTNSYNTFFIDRECCRTIVDGLSMYTDIYNQTTNEVGSGYVCCKRQINCSCNVTKDWVIAPTPIYIDGYNQPFINFITLNGIESGQNVVVGADNTICPPSLWAEPVNNVVDPYFTNATPPLVGIGCRLTEYGLANYNILYSSYLQRSEENTGCSHVFPEFVDINGRNGLLTSTQQTCLPPMLKSVVRNLINNSVTFNWVLNNTPCNTGVVHPQFSLDGTYWEDLNSSSSTTSISDLTVTTIGGLLFNSFVYFRLMVDYEFSSDCNPPLTKCNGVVSETLTLDFTNTQV
jgi:hypothetical protein